MFNYFIIFFLISIFLIIHFSRKYNLFVDYKKEKHKRFATNLKSYSIGGILLITFFTYNFILNGINHLLFFFSYFYFFNWIIF